MLPFDPLFRNPHLQTLAGHFWPLPPHHPAPIIRRFLETEPGVQVLIESQLPTATPRGHLILLHGLEGSSESGYMLAIANAALQSGFAAHRFNMRTCGGTAKLCPTLYHAGLTGDLLAYLRALESETAAPVFLIGFSLGGNVVLKLAGEAGASGSSLLRAVCAVSTPLDLAACVRQLAHPSNRVYHVRFVRRMRARLVETGRYDPGDLATMNSVEAIDDRITAPSFGFGNAANYYRTQSAIRFLESIRIPTLLIQARDDIFIPFEIYSTLPRYPCIQLHITDHGGHLGFIGRRPHRFWLQDAIMGWVLQHT